MTLNPTWPLYWFFFITITKNFNFLFRNCSDSYFKGEGISIINYNKIKHAAVFVVVVFSFSYLFWGKICYWPTSAPSQLTFHSIYRIFNLGKPSNFHKLTALLSSTLEKTRLNSVSGQLQCSGTLLFTSRGCPITKAFTVINADRFESIDVEVGECVAVTKVQAFALLDKTAHDSLATGLERCNAAFAAFG